MVNFVKSWQIAGYTYGAGNYHADCLVNMFVAAGELSPAARDMGPEAALDQHANACGIDRDDEGSFDSSSFPKVIHEDNVSDGDVCGSCGTKL